jgi:hypothetical protein
LVDQDECRFDHHGGCHAHGYLSLEPGEQCPHAEAKALVGPWEPAEQPPTPTEADIAAALQAEKRGVDSEQFQREILGMWPAEQPEDGAR